MVNDNYLKGTTGQSIKVMFAFKMNLTFKIIRLHCRHCRLQLQVATARTHRLSLQLTPQRGDDPASFTFTM